MSEGTPTDPSGTSDARPVFDLTILRQQTGGDASLAIELMRLCIAECPAMLAQVQSAVEMRDVAKLRFTAHTLRGALANFGAHRAVEASQVLESLARQGTLDDVDECYRELAAAWVELEQALLAQLGKG